MSPIRDLAVEKLSSSRDKTISIHMINIWSMISEMLLENLRNIIVMIIGRNSNVVLIWCYSLKKVTFDHENAHQIELSMKISFECFSTPHNF